MVGSTRAQSLTSMWGERSHQSSFSHTRAVYAKPPFSLGHMRDCPGEAYGSEQMGMLGRYFLFEHLPTRLPFLSNILVMQTNRRIRLSMTLKCLKSPWIEIEKSDRRRFAPKRPNFSAQRALLQLNLRTACKPSNVCSQL